MAALMAGHALALTAGDCYSDGTGVLAYCGRIFYNNRSQKRKRLTFPLAPAVHMARYTHVLKPACNVPEAQGAAIFLPCTPGGGHCVCCFESRSLPVAGTLPEARSARNEGRWRMAQEVRDGKGSRVAHDAVRGQGQAPGTPCSHCPTPDTISFLPRPLPSRTRRHGPRGRACFLVRR